MTDETDGPDDGGCFYPPVELIDHMGKHEFYHGITRRDWLAGLAMQGMVVKHPECDWEEVAVLSYGLADAVIEEGKK